MSARRYIATMRATYEAEDDVEARVIADELCDRASEPLEEEDTLDVTQVIPIEAVGAVEPSELANEMRLVADKLVATRIADCYDLGSWLHKTAWVLEHRAEEHGGMAGYDFGEFLERAGRVLQRVKGEKK